jgi:hypothetical protein
MSANQKSRILTHLVESFMISNILVHINDYFYQKRYPPFSGKCLQTKFAKSIQGGTLYQYDWWPFKVWPRT